MPEFETAAEKHPKPQGDDIILPDGTVVGTWNGEDVKTVADEQTAAMQKIIDSGY